MLLGYNTNGLQNHRLPDALRLLADHGYQAVALTLDVQHLDPYHATPAQVDETAALLETLGLSVVVETGARYLLDPGHKHEPTLMTRGEEGRRRRLDFYARAARIGAELGAEVVSFWSGIDHGAEHDSAETLRSGVQAACEVIRAEGLTPALEPEPGMAVATVADYQALCAELGGAGPTLCLDIGHLYVTGEGEPGHVIPAVADQISQVHLEDIRRGVHEHLVPGSGDVDFDADISALEKSGYEGPVCFELSRSSHQAPVVLQTCRATWESLG